MSGELVGKSAPQAQIHGKLSPAASAKLRELAEQAGVKPSTLARMLLEELLPTVQSVRMGLRVTRSPNGAKPNAECVGPRAPAAPQSAPAGLRVTKRRRAFRDW